MKDEAADFPGPTRAASVRRRIAAGSGQAGAALVSVLVLAAVLLPIGTWAAWNARLDAALARNLRADMHAFFVADAGLAHAMAAVSRLPSARAALAGPDGVEGTADDGGILAAPGSRVPFPETPYGYSIAAEAVGTDGVRLRSTGFGWDGTVKQVEAVLYWRNGSVVHGWRELF